MYLKDRVRLTTTAIAPPRPLLGSVDAMRIPDPNPASYTKRSWGNGIEAASANGRFGPLTGYDHCAARKRSSSR
jgi:hypothetical protein